jgi:hypothetical protein
VAPWEAKEVLMTNTPDSSSPQDSSPPEAVARVRWWVAAVTGIAGVVVGVLITGMLIATTPDFGSASQDPGGSPAPDSQPSALQTVPVTAEARVNAACLRVINDAQDVYRIISGVGQAADDVDLQRLDDIVRRLQPLEARLERDLLACRVDTSIDSSTGASPAAPVPTLPQPSSSPTR